MSIASEDIKGAMVGAGIGGFIASPWLFLMPHPYSAMAWAFFVLFGASCGFCVLGIAFEEDE